MRLFLDPDFFDPSRSRAAASRSIDFARYCLPQVFFYGMFVLVGQVLNARGRFGPMMWAPIANNVVAVAVLTAYLLTLGPAEGAEKQGGFDRRRRGPARHRLDRSASSSSSWCCCPTSRRPAFTYRPRFDFRGTGLGHTLRLGMWTVLFVVVNQIAYTVVVRLASSGTVDPVAGGAAGRPRAPATPSTPTRSC